jgi:hypothetical protein
LTENEGAREKEEEEQTLFKNQEMNKGSHLTCAEVHAKVIRKIVGIWGGSVRDGCKTRKVDTSEKFAFKERDRRRRDGV